MKTLIGCFLFFLNLSLCYSQQNINPAQTDQQVEAKIEDIIKQMTLPEKLDMLGGYEEFNIRPLQRLGIPTARMADGPCGVRNYGASTAYPAPINTAASWDTVIAAEVGIATAREAKAKDVQIMLAPGMNIYRAAVCGRNFEYLGEDPFLAGKIASAYIKGMQNEGVMATAKHYAANNQEFNRHHVSSDVDERTLHEIYLPAFKTCVDEGDVACIMTAYNLVNGIHASQHDYLINQVLKKDWGFKGIVMSDWVSVYDGVGAANAGLDLEMPSGEHMHRDTLLMAIKNGSLKEEVVNDKIRRMLRMLYKYNLLGSKTLKKDYKINKAELANVALDAARGGIVLLKNKDHLLPLDLQRIKSIAVLGPNAEDAITGGGGSSLVMPYNSVSVLQGIKNAAGNKVTVSYASGPFTKFTDNFFNNTKFEGGSLKGEYYKNMNLKSNAVATRNDKTINHVWDSVNLPSGVPEINFSVRWTGKYKAPATGQFYVVVSGDDGYRLTFDNKLLLDEWRYQGENTHDAKVQLQAGQIYDIKLEYFQGGGGAVIRFGIGEIKEDLLSTSENMAKKADVAIVCIGFDKSTEGEGTDRLYALPPKQEEFIKAIASANKNTVVILTAGGNTAIANWIDNVGALLHTWYPGQEGGQAVSEILFGKVNPSGKLPISIEKRWEDASSYQSYYDDDKNLRVEYKEGILVGYRHFDTHKVEPLFPFGFGLSYTSFEYSNLKIDKKGFTTNGVVSVSVDIKNTGKSEGKEVVQLYISDPESSLPRPLKELKAFAKVNLKPGETKTITMKLQKKDFSFYNPSKHGWAMEPGTFEILMGASSKDIRLSQKIEL